RSHQDDLPIMFRLLLARFMDRSDPGTADSYRSDMALVADALAKVEQTDKAYSELVDAAIEPELTEARTKLLELLRSAERSAADRSPRLVVADETFKLAYGTAYRALELGILVGWQMRDVVN